MMTNQSATHISPGDIVRVLFRHSKKAFSVFCLVVMATVGWIVFAPQKYESSAKVYVRVGRENNTLDPSATTGQTVNIQQTLEAEINSMLEIIGSRETAEIVLAEIGVDAILANDIVDEESGEQASNSSQSVTKKIKNWIYNIKERVLPTRFPESRESLAIRALQQRSKFWSPKKSNVIKISYKARHPKLAQQIAKAWTRAFIDEHLRVTRTEGSVYFFFRQSDEIEGRLSEAEEELKLAKSSAGLISIEGQRQILQEQAKAIRTLLITNNSLLQASKAKVKELQTILETLPARIETDQLTDQSHEGWNGLREQFFALQIREHELKSKFSPANPEVIAVEQQRLAIEKLLATQPQSSSDTTTSPNPTHQLFHQSLLNEKAQVVSLLAERESLEKQTQENLDEFKKLNQSAILIGDMERQRQILETSYLANVARLEQAKVLQALEDANISSVSELQAASFDTQPTGLSRSKTLLLGIFLGVICGVGAVAFAEYFDRTFVMPSQVEQSLEVPVLVSIPRGRRQFVEVS